MAGIYSVSLISAELAAGATGSYEVADDQVVILKDWTVYGGVPTPGLQMAELIAPGGHVIMIAYVGAAPNIGQFEWQGRHVVPAGSIIEVRALVGCNVTLSGYLLTA